MVGDWFRKPGQRPDWTHVTHVDPERKKRNNFDPGLGQRYLFSNVNKEASSANSCYSHLVVISGTGLRSKLLGRAVG